MTSRRIRSEKALQNLRTVKAAINIVRHRTIEFAFLKVEVDLVLYCNKGPLSFSFFGTKQPNTILYHTYRTYVLAGDICLMSHLYRAYEVRVRTSRYKYLPLLVTIRRVFDRYSKNLRVYRTWGAIFLPPKIFSWIPFYRHHMYGSVAYIGTISDKSPNVLSWHIVSMSFIRCISCNNIVSTAKRCFFLVEQSSLDKLKVVEVKTIQLYECRVDTVIYIALHNKRQSNGPM